MSAVLESISLERYTPEIKPLRDFVELIATRYDRLERAKREGRPIVGKLAAFPHEILHAAGAFVDVYDPRSELDRAIIRGEYALKKYIDMFGVGEYACKEIEGSAGSPLFGSLTRTYDLVITSLCPKDRFYTEMLNALAKYFDGRYARVELRRGISKREALDAIEQRLLDVKERLEKITGREITDDDIREACELTNEARELNWEYHRILMEDPAPIGSFFIYLSSLIPYAHGFFGSEVERMCDIWRNLIYECEKRIESGVGAYSGESPNVLLIGTYHKALVDPIEVNELRVVARYPYFDLINTESKVNTSSGDIVRELARWTLEALQGVHGVEEDVREVEEIVDRFDIDGIIYNTRTTCLFVSILESKDAIVSAMEDRGIPVLVVGKRELSDPKLIKSLVGDFAEQLRSN